MLKAQGIWACTVLSATSGDSDRGVPEVQVNVVIDEGPSKGQRCTYQDQVNTKSAKYIAYSLKAIGWKGPSVKTLPDDVAAWIERTGGATTVEIKHVEIKRGKQYDRWIEEGCQGQPPVWDKVNSLGRGAAMPLRPMSESSLADADEVLREFVDEGSPF